MTVLTNKKTGIKSIKAPTAREKGLKSLAKLIGEFFAENEEKRKAAIAEMVEMAQEETKDTAGKRLAWTHTYPAIKNHILIKYEIITIKEEDYYAVADAAAKNKKK